MHYLGSLIVPPLCRNFWVVSRKKARPPPRQGGRAGGQERDRGRPRKRGVQDDSRNPLLKRVYNRIPYSIKLFGELKKGANETTLRIPYLKEFVLESRITPYVWNACQNP